MQIETRKKGCFINASSVALSPNEGNLYKLEHEFEGKWYLRIAGVLCIVLGATELMYVLSLFRVIDFGFIMFRFPWLEAMVSFGTRYMYVINFAMILGGLYLTIGILGLVFSKSEKMSKILALLCAATFAFHIATLAISFFSGGFTYISIFFLAIPVIYFLGAAQNGKNKKLRNTAVAYSFIAPNLIGFGIFTLIPMGFALILSFMQWDLSDNSFVFVGFENFARMPTDHLFWPSLRNTAIFTAIAVPVTMAVALCLALLLNNKLKGRAIFRGVMFFPYVASLIAMAAVWNQIFHPSWGPVNQFLNWLGMDSIQFTITPWIIPNIAFFTAWRNMGYFMIVYLAGLQSIPTELYEAAAIDGASSFKRFLYITWPQLRFVTFFVSVMLTIICFRVFDQVIIITNNDTPGTSATTLVVHIFRVAFRSYDFGYASSIAMVLLSIVLTITVIQFLIQKRIDR